MCSCALTTPILHCNVKVGLQIISTWTTQRSNLLWLCAMRLKVMHHSVNRTPTANSVKSTSKLSILLRDTSLRRMMAALELVKVQKQMSTSITSISMKESISLILPLTSTRSTSQRLLLPRTLIDSLGQPLEKIQCSSSRRPPSHSTPSRGTKMVLFMTTRDLYSRWKSNNQFTRSIRRIKSLSFMELSHLLVEDGAWWPVSLPGFLRSTSGSSLTRKLSLRFITTLESSKRRLKKSMLKRVLLTLRMVVNIYPNETRKHWMIFRITRMR